MNKWTKKLKNGFLHEKTAAFSLLFLLIVLSLDCFFQNLPISGYGLVLLTLILISCTTYATCHGIKWVINSSKPLQFHISEKSQNEKWVQFWEKSEDEVFKRVFSTDNKCFDSFKYPTNLNEQVRLLLKDIERDFIKIWYSEISQNPSFLFDSHLILEEIFFKVVKKLKTVSCKNIILSILILYLNHLQEYKRSVKKMVRLNNEDGSKPKIELPDLCRYLHPGSQSDQILDYYFKKMTKTLLKEFAPHDFGVSLECKILSGIIGRKVFKRLLTTVEDPTWVNIKLVYLLNGEKHKDILGEGMYVVKEKTVVPNEEELPFKKPAILSKRYLSSNLFDSNKSLFDRSEFHNVNNQKVVENGESPSEKPVGREGLSLPLNNSKTPLDESKGNISTVLSGLISSTAGPLLPDNISVRYHALNKMWQSPVAEVSESITNSFKKVFFDGVKEKKGIVRSKSTEFLPEVAGSLRTKDISVGEELCENIRFSLGEVPKAVKKLTKTRSFDNDSLMLDDVPDGREPSPEKKTPSPDQRDVSPVYEEPEDFATTIAKLRSLLQQHESNSTLSDKSNPSLDSQSLGLSLDKSDSSNKSIEGESFDSMACDIPTDGRLFINISVPKGELVTDSGGAPFVLYTIQYDGIYVLKNGQNPGAESELVLQTTLVKRRFQEFLHLQARLEENSNYKAIMKGIKGPSKWLHLPASGRPDETTSRRAILESFLRQLCARVEMSNSSELHEFLGYGQNGNVKKDANSSLQRIDKLLANKVTGVFNSIKTALPSFDFDSPALIATNDTVKGFQEQKLLQGFLNFGNKPDSYELNFTFAVKEPTGDSLTDDIRRYFREKSDCIEDAVDVLDSNDWLAEQRECRFISGEEKCVWHGYKDIALDDELEPLDSWLPVFSLLLDIICELLQDSDSWAIKESVIRLAKVVFGHWEKKIQEELSGLDWDRIFANVVRLLRGVVFLPSEGAKVKDVSQEETKQALKDVIMELMPGWITEVVKPDGVLSAVSLFVDSFQHHRLNRDVLLRLTDILLAHLLSCPHLTGENFP